MSRGVSEFLSALAGGLGGATQGMLFNEQRRAQDAERERQRRAEALQLLITRDQLGLVDEDPTRHSFTAPAPSAAIRETIKASGMQDTLTPMLQSARPDTRQAVTVTDPISGQPMRLRLDPTQSAAGRARTAAREDAMSAFTREQGALLDRDRRAAQAAKEKADADNRAAFATIQQLFPGSEAAKAYNPTVQYATVLDRVAKVSDDTRNFNQQRSLVGMQIAAADRRARESSGAMPRVSEGERAAAGYLGRLRAATAQFDGDQAAGTAPVPVPNNFQIFAGERAPRWASEDFRRWEQARKNFATALLRRESGASIAPQEYESVDAIYIPLPGDSKEVLELKANNRRLALQQLEIGAGPLGAPGALDRFQPTPTGGAIPAAAPQNTPAPAPPIGAPLVGGRNDPVFNIYR